MPGSQLPQWFISFVNYAAPIMQLLYWLTIPIILFLAYRLLRNFLSVYVSYTFPEEYMDVDEEYEEDYEEEDVAEKPKTKASSSKKTAAKSTKKP